MASNSRRTSAKDALEPDTYFRLYQGALQIESYERRLIACFVILVAGRLGLRIAEIQHLREEHIHWKRGEICLPEFDPCACRRCWLQALDRWGRKGLKELQERGEWDDSARWKRLTAEEREEVAEKAEYCTSENLLELVYTQQFTPKYDRSARVIAFGWSYRITACLFTFFDEFDCLEWQQYSINRLLKEAAENADGVDPEHISAHRLRATGETFLADVSVDPKMLKDLAGWELMETGNNYWGKSGRVNTLKLYHLMGKGDEAPPVVPEDPEHEFPVACNPVPFQNEPFHPLRPDGTAYDQGVRAARHEEQAKKPLRLRHPREVDLPYGRAGFPSPDEISYDPAEHAIPGHIDPEADHVEAQGGEIVTRATTIYEFTDPHRMTRSPEPEPGKYRLDGYDADLGSFVQDDDDDGPMIRSVTDVGSAAVLSVERGGNWIEERLRREWRDYWTAGDRGYVGHERAAKGVAMYLLGVVAPLSIVFALMLAF